MIPIVGKLEFLNACRTNNIATVRQYIAEGRDVNAVNKFYLTPLIWAVYNRNVDCVRELIAAGADIYAQRRDGWTALLYAVSYGDIECFREILAAHVASNRVEPWYVMPALMRAAENGRTDFIEELLAAGIDVNSNINNGTTALALALKWKRYDTALFLVKHGADIYIKNNAGRQIIDTCGDKRIKARLIRLSQRHIKAAIKSADKPDIIKGFDIEL